MVLTDSDPKVDDEGNTQNYGENRVVNQIMTHLIDIDIWDKKTDVLNLAPDHGVFLNSYTFEVDLIKANTSGFFLEVTKQSTNKNMHKRFKDLHDDPTSLNEIQFLKDIETIGKGRFAQRLAAVIEKSGADACPPYIKQALDYLRAKLK